MAPGFHIQASNQFLLKNYEIESDFPTVEIADGKFESTEPTLLLPNVHAVYNGGKWAAFASFGVTAGGGTLVYEDGIPEYNAGLYQAGMAAYMATGDPAYASTLKTNKIEGSSMYLAGTLGGAYAINDMFSVSLAGKYVNSTKTFTVSPVYKGGPLDGDQKMEYEDTASGFGGILGVNVRVNNQLNIGFRIESEIGLEYKRDVKKDFSSTLEDGAKIDRDLPAVIGLGVEYKINEQFLVRPTFQGYMIGWANESKKDGYNDEYDDFGWEAGIGFEYAIMPKFLVASLGYLYSDLGGNDKTYSDGEYALDAHSIGTGFKVTPAPNVDVTLGVSGTFYAEGKSDTIGFDEKFNKRVINIALGAEYRI